GRLARPSLGRSGADGRLRLRTQRSRTLTFVLVPDHVPRKFVPGLVRHTLLRDYGQADRGRRDRRRRPVRRGVPTPRRGRRIECAEETGSTPWRGGSAATADALDQDDNSTSAARWNLGTKGRRVDARGGSAGRDGAGRDPQPPDV